MTTESAPLSDDASISDYVDRLETIIEQLEDGEVSLERAQELRTEGETLLDHLEETLDIGDGEILEQS